MPPLFRVKNDGGINQKMGDNNMTIIINDKNYIYDGITVKNTVKIEINGDYDTDKLTHDIINTIVRKTRDTGKHVNTVSAY